MLRMVEQKDRYKSQLTGPSGLSTSTLFRSCHFGIFCYMPLNLILRRQKTNIFGKSGICGMSQQNW